MLSRVRVDLLCLVVCLVGCAPVPDPMAKPAAACLLERVAEMPVRFAEGAILVPAHINRTEVEMQVDTGATNDAKLH
jgi:hypothetical protein